MAVQTVEHRQPDIDRRRTCSRGSGDFDCHEYYQGVAILVNALRDASFVVLPTVDVEPTRNFSTIPLADTTSLDRAVHLH